jgi:raffinose/stachyose/melibiose transport system substrate-binding protein
VRKLLLVKRKLYAYAAGFGPGGILYNRDKFRELGLKVPTNTAELVALCGKIRAAGKIPISASFSSGFTTGAINTTGHMLANFVYNKDPNWTLERIQKKVTFASSPLWQRLLQTLVQYKDANCYQPAPAGTTTTTQYQLVASEQALMMAASSSEAAILKSLNPNLNLGMFAWPADNSKDTSAFVTTGQNVLAASAVTDHPKEARAFIDFVARPKQNSLYAKVQALIAGDDLVKGNLPDVVREMAPLFKAGKAVVSPSAGWPRPDKGMYLPGLTGQLPGLFTGQLTPAQILANMDALWDKP